MTPKVAVVQGLRPTPFGTLASFFHERSGAAGGGAQLKLDLVSCAEGASECCGPATAFRRRAAARPQHSEGLRQELRVSKHSYGARSVSEGAISPSFFPQCDPAKGRGMD